MVIFNSYVTNYQRVSIMPSRLQGLPKLLRHLVPLEGLRFCEARGGTCGLTMEMALVCLRINCYFIIFYHSSFIYEPIGSGLRHKKLRCCPTLLELKLCPKLGYRDIPWLMKYVMFLINIPSGYLT